MPLAVLLAVLIYNIPPVHARLAWRVDDLRTRIQYAINPPEKVVFIPEEQIAPIVEATLKALTPSVTLEPMFTPTPINAGPTATPLPSATPTNIPTPLPGMVRLEGVQYEDQHNRWNYCGPANMSMALTFWGWDGDRDVVGNYVKTNDDDKNVMPYELADFVESQVEDLGAFVRAGGDIDLLKRMVAAGFPVVAEKGYYTRDYSGKMGWLGHYQFVTGYDDSKGVLIVQDTYIPEGENHEFPYEDFIAGWRSFNYVFIVVYPLDRQAEVMALMGEWADVDWANRHALEVARQEVQTLTGIDQYFAAFNVGTGHVNLFEYVDAAYAYDYTFELYRNLPDDGMRPYRMLWYQTGPYFAYFYSQRYQDVINLADATFGTISEPVLEESLYWRGKAKLALGDQAGAISDFRASLVLHPGFAPSLSELQSLGEQP
jgi:Peptidase_C39 like family